MQVEMLKAKLHQACITDGNVNYEGSFGIDTELMEAVGLYPYEKVLIANINNGSRLETYVIPEPFGSRRMVLNGAAARHGSAGDRVIIMSFCMVEESAVREGRHKPRVLRLDENNDPVYCNSHRLKTGAIPGEEFVSMLEG
ncbi:MAG: aspartate 1-decarboxylase [Planctomycetota bacterium]|jgi:aspartate 1-decarboxylase